MTAPKPPPPPRPKPDPRRGPRQPLVREEDGTYRQPAGRPPNGKYWHVVVGRWVKDGCEPGDDDDDDEAEVEVGASPVPVPQAPVPQAEAAEAAAAHRSEAAARLREAAAAKPDGNVPLSSSPTVDDDSFRTTCVEEPAAVAAGAQPMDGGLSLLRSQLSTPMEGSDATMGSR